MSENNQDKVPLSGTEFIEKFEKDKRIANNHLFNGWKKIHFKRKAIAQEFVAHLNGIVASNLIKDYEDTDNQVFFNEVKRYVIGHTNGYSGETFWDDLNKQINNPEIVKIKKQRRYDSSDTSFLFTNSIRHLFDGTNTRLNKKYLLLFTCFFLYDEDDERRKDWNNLSKAQQEVRRWSTTPNAATSKAAQGNGGNQVGQKTTTSEKHTLSENTDQDAKKNLELNDLEAGRDIDLDFNQKGKQSNSISMNGIRAGQDIKASSNQEDEKKDGKNAPN